MRRSPDAFTLDLFASVPKPASLESSVMSIKVKIAHAMSRAMKNFKITHTTSPDDRYEIAARMSRILGRDVSKHMLDAYASASRDTHIPNLEFCIAFDAATEQNELLNLYASLRGCAVLVGEDTLRAELGRLEMQEQDTKARKRWLKEYLSRSRDHKK